MQQNIEMTNINTSAKQLVMSTILAAVVAGGILVTVVLPSEYAIDVTGVGKLIGLQRMGEIKQSLAQDALKAEQQSLLEAATEEVASSQSLNQSKALSESSEKQIIAPQIIVPQITKVAVEEAAKEAAKKEEPQKIQQAEATKDASQITQHYTIKPNDSLELKVAMAQGKELRYNWQVEGGTLNFDNHGDRPGVKYFNYSKGRNVKSDGGKITAEFDGNHGWFWRNRSAGTVALTITFSGDYTEVKAPVRN